MYLNEDEFALMSGLVRAVEDGMGGTTSWEV